MPVHDRQAVLARIEAQAIIAIIRGESAQQALDICRALRAGGVTILEISLTTPGALDAIETASSELGTDCLIGAGTVLNVEAAKAVVAAGSAFVFAPNVNLAVIQAVRSLNRVVVPGALTPTEVVSAMEAGADVIKLFPANHFGPSYIQDLRGPLPGVKIIPTGGIDRDNAADWLKAGALAVGVGTTLARKDLIRRGAWDELSRLAQDFVNAVALGRRRSATPSPTPAMPG